MKEVRVPDFAIELYENQNGRRVVEEELDEIGEQTPELPALLLAGINKLKRREYHGPPLCSLLGDDLFEL